MTAAKLLRYFGYAASALVSLTGCLIIAGLILPLYVPSTFRVMFGVVLVLYGVYRYVAIRFKRRDNGGSLP
jgi:hypothetical protein